MTDHAIASFDQIASDPWNWTLTAIIGTNAAWIHEWLNVGVAGLSMIALGINIYKNLKKPKP